MYKPTQEDLLRWSSKRTVFFSDGRVEGCRRLTESEWLEQWKTETNMFLKRTQEKEGGCQ